MSTPATSGPAPDGSMVGSIIAAYEAAREREERRTPAWDALPLDMQLVLIGVYFAGKRAGADARRAVS